MSIDDILQTGITSLCGWKAWPNTSLYYIHILVYNFHGNASVSRYCTETVFLQPHTEIILHLCQFVSEIIRELF